MLVGVVIYGLKEDVELKGHDEFWPLGTVVLFGETRVRRTQKIISRGSLLSSRAVLWVLVNYELVL